VSDIHTLKYESFIQTHNNRSCQVLQTAPNPDLEN